MSTPRDSRAPRLFSPYSLWNEQGLGAVPRLSRDVTEWIDGLTPPGFPVHDTDWVTSGVATPKAGVSVTNQSFCRVGRVVFFDLAMASTVAYTPPASGDIPNTTFVVNLASGWYPTSGPTQAVQGHGATGRMISGAVTTGGEMYVGAVATTGAFAVGNSLRLGGSYVL